VKLAENLPTMQRQLRVFCASLLLAACQNTATSDLLNATALKIPLKISPSEATVTISSTQQFIATGGTPPYTYAVFSGNGTISGSVYTAPTAIGTAVVTVKDASGTTLAVLITIVTDANCPTNYVPVPKNTTVGMTADFCVSKYEMKCNNDATGAACTGSPVAMAANQPWVNITQGNAKAACSTLGGQYHLITNAEWMTLARNIEAVPGNWSSGAISSGALNRGHTDSAPTATLAASTDSSPCSGTGEICSTAVWHDQRRTHTLSNGHAIWDLSGNAKEYIDWYLPTGRAASGNASYIEINAQTVTGSMPATAFKSNDLALIGGNGIGKYWPGTDGTNGYAARGGHYDNGVSQQAGVYLLDFDNASGDTNNRLGFRCAYQ
jgi:hypothetical protein